MAASAAMKEAPGGVHKKKAPVKEPPTPRRSPVREPPTDEDPVKPPDDPGPPIEEPGDTPPAKLRPKRH